jgi:ATP-binding cassette subfamily F protein uup
LVLNITPVILSAKELKLEYGEQKVLQNSSLSIHEGSRIGLVGRNGAGKSSFLKIICGLMQADSGEVTKKKDLTIGFLSQEFTLLENETVKENILDGASKIVALLADYEKLAVDSAKHHELEERINMVDGWNLDRNIDILLKEIHAPDPERIVSTLSGGEKRRVAICRALISNPDLLILDEPTNHLDTDSIEWIENFLNQYKGTCIFVTHDRYFLDRIATRIVELSNGEFYSHAGNYTEYLINKTQREAIQEVEEKKRQNFLRRELDWVMRGPRARRTKAKSRLDNYYEVASQQPVEVELDVDLIIPVPENLGNKVLELDGVSAGIAGKTLFHSLMYDFKPGRKLGIIGKNGVGKTTLLRIILGELEPETGSIEKGERTEFNYIDQARILLNDEDTVLETIGEGKETIRFGKQQMPVWTYLRRFLFADERMNTRVGKLSGGERSRLTLAKILKNGGNFLLLDEPTNDLDLPTLRILEEALIGFAGCVVVVSHDRYFLNRVCNGILAFENDGALYVSEGNYDYYLEKRKHVIAKSSDDIARIKKEDTRIKKTTVKLTWKEKIELENIEADISTVETEIQKIEGLFSDAEFYKKHGDKTAQLTEELNSAKNKVEILYKRWEELETKKNVSTS